MASEQDDTVYLDESHDLDEDEEESESDEDLEENDDVLVPEDDEDEPEEEEELNSASTSSPPAVSVANVATTTTSTVTPATSTICAVTVAVPAAVPLTTIPNGTDQPLMSSIDDPLRDSKRHRMADLSMIVHEDKQRPIPQLDESRRLFQRLWTDEDEIELLQGFLEYTTSHRGIGNSHHPDTALFYDQIKSKLQLDFNKNQLVEKLRRLKKKYRNVMSKISSGKDFSFKSPHDQATFEISRKIWSNTGKILGFEDNVLDYEETNNNVNNNHNNINPHPNFEMKIEDGVERKGSSRSRKRSRSKSIGKIEEKRNLGDGFVLNSDNFVGAGAGAGATTAGATTAGGSGGMGNVGVGATEETLRNCLSPVFKEALNGAMMMMMGGRPCGGRGIGAWNPLMPINFGGMVGFGGGSGSDVVDERWRKQQIMELEVYSKRLELVQDQIKASLQELRSTGGG